MTAERSLFILLLIVLITSTCGTASAIDTDYYRAFVNTDGSLNFVNKSTGATILSNSPKFYLNYGATTSTAKTVLNNSFEIDNNHDNIPDNWSVDKTYIRLSTEQASDGSKSLKFDATAPDTLHRHAFSTLFTVTQDAKYTISIDSYVSDFTSSYIAGVYAYYYETVNGTGTAYSSSDYVSVPNITGSWVHLSFTWTPPISARSFKVMIYMANSSVATIYFDNVSVIEKSYVYASNGSNIEPDVVVNGDTTTITATDDSNPYTTVNHQYQLNTHSPYINYTATLQYKQDVCTTGERFDFAVPSQIAQVMTRDLQLTFFNTSKTYWSDLYTPKVVKFANGLSFLGSDTMESMRLQTSGSNSQVSFYSDYGLNHPHFYYVANGNGATTYVNETQRSAGDTYSASVTFAIDTSEFLQCLVKTRQPYGYDATLTLTNHPDNETLDRIKAVAYGSENESDPAYGTKGIAGRGIGWTKGVFVSGGGTTNVDLTNANYKALIDQIYQDGVIIVGHSITPNTDSRAVVAAGLATLSQYNARGWIDHGASGGTGNWEDLASQGAIKGSAYYILDLLDQYNYQYAWSYIDLTTDNYALNMLKPSATADIRPFLFYNNRVDDNVYDNKKIYLWSTINTNKTPDYFYTNDRVNTLISERGIHISHEYFGYIDCQNHAWYNHSGTIEIWPTFDSELGYIAGKEAAGLIWSPPRAELGDYLVPLKDVLVTYNSDGTITVTNNSSVDVTGITLLAENNIQSVTIDNYDLVSFGDSYGDKELVLPTIASGGSVVLDISYGAKDSSVPTIVSNDTGKNKVNEITGYWDNTRKILTMTAKGHNGNYSFSVTIPSLANKTIIVKNVTLDTIIGEYNASDSGTITFTAFLDSLYTFKITEQPFVDDFDVDNFDSYWSDSELQNVWYPHPSFVRLNTDPDFVRSGNSMKYGYEEHAEVEVNTEDLPYQIKSDWTVDGVKALVLYFYGDPCNSVLPMYVKLKDGSGHEGVVTYGDSGEDPNDLRAAGWHEWNIDLAIFDACGVDLIDVEYVYLGFGSGNGSGTLYFDGIRLYPTRCVLSKRSADFARVDYAPLDSDGYPSGDCVVDYQELAIMADYWLDTWSPIPPSIPNLVAYWPMNEGASNGIFTDPCDPCYAGTFSAAGVSWTTPGVTGSGSGALHFDGGIGTRVSCGNKNPASEANELTLAIWVKWLGPRTWDPYLYNKSQGLISKRTDWSPTGLQFMFECDTPDHRGSFSLRQYDDLNTDVYSPNDILDGFIGQWVHLAATFDGTTSETACKLYLNGSEVASGPFFFGSNTAAGLTIGNTNDEAGWDDCPESFNGYLDEARIYNRALTADEIGYLADQGRPHIDLYNDCVACPECGECPITIDFKDFAVLANYWLEEQLWP